MAQLFIDSFDHYLTADITAKWTSTSSSSMSVAISSAAGRRSGSGLRISDGGFNSGAYGFVKKTLAASGAGFVVGMFVKRSIAATASGDYLVGIVESSTAHVYLRLNTDYTFSVLRGDGTVLGTSTGSGLSDGIGAYVEFKGTINDTTGTYSIRINGATTILAHTGKDTQNGGTSTWNALWLGIINSQTTAAAFNQNLDDLYVFDQSGSVFNDWYGDARVDVRTVTGAGTTTQFTPSTGSNYQNVDDTTPNGDADYNSSSTAAQIDTFATQDAPVVGGGVALVQVSIYAKKSDSGTCTIAAVVRHSGSNYSAAAQAPSTSYGYLTTLYATNPGTSAAWVESDFNSAEFGYGKAS